MSFEPKFQQLSNEQKLEIAREKFIQSIAENIDLYGITDSIGRLYGTLYFSNEPLTLDEMREALGMSKTSMSTGVRTLLETKMVRKVWKKVDLPIDLLDGRAGKPTSGNIAANKMIIQKTLNFQSEKYPW